jgi:hypothetical protein
MTDKIKAYASSPSKLWDLVIKLVIITVLPWSIWVTSNVMHYKNFSSVDRFTREDGYKLRSAIYEVEKVIDRRLDEMPPRDWRDRIIALEKSVFVRKDEL